MGMPTMITDRTQADVTRVYLLKDKILKGENTAQELQEWLAGMKGSYNASDFNRVNSAVGWIAQELTALGITVNVTVKSDWAYADIPTTENVTALLNSIQALKDAVRLSQGTVPQDMDKLSIDTANAIESLLIAIEGIAASWNNQVNHSGGTFSGFTGGLIK